MKRLQPRPFVALGLLPVVAALAGCGGSSSPKHAGAVRAATTTSAASTVAVASTHSAAPKLRILAPRSGATASQTLTVRVKLTGARASGGAAFRYVLDRRITRLGASRLTFTGLAGGHHLLTVMLASDHAVRAKVSFKVPAPTPPPVTTTTTTAPPPPATTTSVSAPPPTTTTTHPAAGNGIPQGPNAGDGDGDNHGGPTDGDGNI